MPTLCKNNPLRGHFVPKRHAETVCSASLDFAWLEKLGEPIKPVQADHFEPANDWSEAASQAELDRLSEPFQSLVYSS